MLYYDTPACQRSSILRHQILFIEKIIDNGRLTHKTLCNIFHMPIMVKEVGEIKKFRF